MNSATDLVARFSSLIVKPTILLVFTAGFFLFVWGLVEFIYKLDEGGDHREGKDHMLWGLIGMLIMISVYGILNVLDGTFNLQSTRPDMSRIQNIAPLTGSFFGPAK